MYRGFAETYSRTIIRPDHLHSSSDQNAGGRMSTKSIQNGSSDPAQPVYVLRGHNAQIHALHFYRDNTRLVTGDADGWIVVWNMPIKRAAAVWRAHTDTVLGIVSWSSDKLITHGREGKIQVWQLDDTDESQMSTTLPIDDATTERKAPWLLHSIPVHALNFCSVAICNDPAIESSLLIAAPGLQDGAIIVNQLPSEARVATIPPPKDFKVGMLMAVGLHMTDKHDLLVMAGYESGHAAVWHKVDMAWQMLYIEKAHSQPVMSLDIAHQTKCFFTSSADAVLAQHTLKDGAAEMRIVQTKHAGQQSVQVRSDEKIFATAGWDRRARVYSVKSMKELAVLKWHKEGCYATAFAEIADGRDEDVTATTVAAKRMADTKTTHWLAIGSKDGKVSLWDIY